MELQAAQVQGITCLGKLLMGKDPEKLGFDPIETTLIRTLFRIINDDFSQQTTIYKELTTIEIETLKMIIPLFNLVDTEADKNIYELIRASHTISCDLNGVVQTGQCKGREMTLREKEVLILISHGYSNKEIAQQLNIGLRTVETHRERIIRKLNIHSTAGLTRYAIVSGLTTLEPTPSSVRTCPMATS